MSDLDTLARELWQARRDGHTIPLPAEAPSLAEAYRVQEAIAALAASRRAPGTRSSRPNAASITATAAVVSRASAAQGVASPAAA